MVEHLAEEIVATEMGAGEMAEMAEETVEHLAEAEEKAEEMAEMGAVEMAEMVAVEMAETVAVEMAEMAEETVEHLAEAEEKAEEVAEMVEMVAAEMAEEMVVAEMAEMVEMAEGMVETGLPQPATLIVPRSHSRCRALHISSLLLGVALHRRLTGHGWSIAPQNGMAIPSGSENSALNRPRLPGSQAEVSPRIRKAIWAYVGKTPSPVQPHRSRMFFLFVAVRPAPFFTCIRWYLTGRLSSTFPRCRL